MRAVRLASFGIENIRLEDVSAPDAGPRAVLIGTEPTPINPAEQMMGSGATPPFLPPSVTGPYTPGRDLASDVLGDRVDTSLVGSRVVGGRIELSGGRGL